MKSGTTNTIRKLALKIVAPALLVFMAWNGYLAVNHLIQLENIAVLTRESSTIQANISSILQDLTDMETGQRGYLLTADPSYLTSYTDAMGRIAGDFANLRMRLANRAENEASLLSQLESLANSKQAEMERSINLRQQGYRRRAFRLVDSNEGFEYMNKARGLLTSLSAAQAGITARLDKEREASLGKTLTETVVVNSCLFVVCVCLFGLIRSQWKLLELEVVQSRQELSGRDLQLEKLTSALSNQARSKTFTIEASARLLLQNYGGFLPRQGHKYAEQIRDASAQMERLRQDLVGSSSTNNDEQAEYDSVA